MLTEKQLQDCENCGNDCINCDMCSMKFEKKRMSSELCNTEADSGCMLEVAQTALAYRDMLKRLEWKGSASRCVMCNEYVHSPDCELAALLWDGEKE